MINDYGVLPQKLTEIASRYSRGLCQAELQAFCSELARFPLAVALAAIEAIPDAYPAALPSPGELAEVCKVIAATHQVLSDWVSIIRAMAECDHDYEFHPEPDGGPYKAFAVCRICGRSKPVLADEETDEPAQVAYFPAPASLQILQKGNQ